MTPNTKSIMLTVQPERRGIANGIRSMLQNMGAVVSTAVSLMMVTSALPGRLKDEIYAGTEIQFTEKDVHLMIGGYRVAFIVMLVMSLLAIAASYLRSSAKGSTKLN